jgi:hypothetical protein
MTTPSNLYAEKIFAEHPTAFWAMDGEADYLSLISNENRALSTWTASGTSATAITDTSDKNQKFLTAMSKIELSAIPTSSGGSYTFTSPNLFNLNELDSAMNSATFGFYYLSTDDNIDKIEIGFKYNSTEYLSEIATPNTSGDWQFVSKTITFATGTSRNVQTFVRVTYTQSSTQKATIFVNGVHLGAMSEEFVKTSGGQFSGSLLPASLASYLSGLSGVTTSSYGDTNKNGYYLVKSKTLRARNTSIPMVYGAENSTSLLDNGTQPSIIIPGQGFMHNIGRNQDQTLEFWLRKNQYDQKICGPVDSENGLYSLDGSLVLRVGNSTQSYFVGEWSRPMLVHIESQTNNYSVLINGEKVLSLDVESNNLSLPKTQLDWIGFYGSSAGIEIDNVAIYPYLVPDVIAKRRFVYGQGVEYPLNVNSKYNGKSIFIDYRFAEYSNNYSYPNIGNWKQGTYDNIVPLDNALSLPEYSLPVFQVSKASTNTAQDWLDYHSAGGAHMTGYFEFEPSGFDGSSEATDLNIYFAKLSSIIQERVSAITGVFDVNSGSGTRTLIRIINRSNRNSLSIKVNSSNNVVCEIYSDTTLSSSIAMLTAPSGPFLVGIDIDKLSSLNPLVSSLFENPDDVSVYVGSNENFTQPCGNVSLYSFGFSTKRNFQKHFTSESSGVIKKSDGTSLTTNNYASYRLTPIALSGSSVVNTAIPDVQVTSYWEDYVPLSVLAKEVYLDFNQTMKKLEVDFIQFNLDSTGIETAWASFQYLSDGANAIQSSFGTSRVKDSADKKIILPDEMGWEDTRFEIADGYILYAPTHQDGSGTVVDIKDIALSLHIEFKNIGITYNPDIRIKSLQLASQALNYESANYVNTAFSEKILPVVPNSMTPEKSQNPYRIYKSSTPYLYLSGNSGIEIAGHGLEEFDSSRAMFIGFGNFTYGGNLSSLQMAIRYGDNASFPNVETPIFEIASSSGAISFYIERAPGPINRARIYAKKSGTELFYNSDGIQEIEYHLNGKEVQNPVITVGEWAMLGITFPIPLILGYGSSINLTGPLLFNNISYYQVDTTKLDEQTSYNDWSDVDNTTWGVVDDKTWQENLISSEASLISIDPSVVYSVYLGTNKVIVDTTDNGDAPVLTATGYEYKIYKDISWQSQTILPT